MTAKKSPSHHSLYLGGFNVHFLSIPQYGDEKMHVTLVRYPLHAIIIDAPQSKSSFDIEG